MLIWRFTHDHWLVVWLKWLLLRERLLSCSNSSSEFPISFTIKLVCSNEYISRLFLSCVQKNQISRQSFILVHFDNVAYFDVFTVDHLLTAASFHSRIFLLVDLLVSFESQQIVPSFFNHCNDEHKRKRSNVSKQESDSKNGEELGNSNH